ncbi:MAG: hypothetical protein ABIJ92_05460 [Candidatus Aenigmatarchaeota archaeon]
MSTGRVSKITARGLRRYQGRTALGLGGCATGKLDVYIGNNGEGHSVSFSGVPLENGDELEIGARKYRIKTPIWIDQLDFNPQVLVIRNFSRKYF